MELVPGHTLRDVIRTEAPMPPAQALALLEPVVSALAAAHRAGVIHRDIKPENVLIADDGRVKVADFGLAKAVTADTRHTATGGVLIGTVSYLAPELVVDGTSDARADVYAVGVVLYELLTGSKPHEGESPIAVAYKHVHEDVPPPSEAVPGIPPYVDALVARATARDRAQRPADAGRAAPPAPPGRPGRGRRRRGRRGADRRPGPAHAGDRGHHDARRRAGADRSCGAASRRAPEQPDLVDRLMPAGPPAPVHAASPVPARAGAPGRRPGASPWPQASAPTGSAGPATPRRRACSA